MTALDANTLASLDKLLVPSQRSDVPGYIVGVARHGRTVYRRATGLASLEQAVANTPATRLRIASVTKQFTGLAVMLLVEEGLVDIDQPLNTYLTDLAGPNGRPTLRQLLNHTSGLRDALESVAYFLTEGLFPQIPAGLTHQWSSRFSDSNFAPGESWSYSNYGYLLLSLVIEKVSGLSLAEFFRQRLFAPLGMVDSLLWPNDMHLLPGLATSHIRLPDGRYRRGIYPCEELVGGGGIVSTVDDMLRWASNLREQRLGSAASWAEILRKPRFNNGSEHNYGFGLKCQSHRGVELRWHDGSTLGSKAALLCYPTEGLDIVVLANRSDSEPGAIGIKIAELLLADVLGPPKVDAEAAGCETLIGDYYSPEARRVFSIRPHQGKLLFAINANPEGLLREEDGGLGNDSSFGPVRVHPTASVDAIEVEFCGTCASYRKLTASAPTASELAPGLVGDYRLQDFSTPVQIVLDQGQLWVDLNSRYHPARMQLTPVSTEVCLCTVTVLGSPAQGTVTLERGPDGAISGFFFSLQRTWNLYFQRHGASTPA